MAIADSGRARDAAVQEVDLGSNKFFEDVGERALMPCCFQILDDGRVTDSQGRTVSFKNTILIMTSNLGSQAILEGMAARDSERVKETVMSMVRPDL
jgi:hypothetical protein